MNTGVPATLATQDYEYKFTWDSGDSRFFI